MVLDPVGFIRCSLEQHPNGTLMSKEHDFRRPPQALSCRVSSMRSRRAFPSGIKSAKQDSAALPPWSCRPLQDADAVPAIGNLNLFFFFLGPSPSLSRTLRTLSTSSCIMNRGSSWSFTRSWLGAHEKRGMKDFLGVGVS